MSDTNCPYCGEPEETDTPSCITIYRCGTRIYPNGSSETPLICDLGRDLRREREAHNQTKRERDEARKHLKEIEEYGTDEINAAVDLRRNLAQALVDLDDMQYQRDEARAERDILRLDAQREAEHHDRMVSELEKVYKERDEAREDVVKLQDIKRKHEHEELVAAQENDRLNRELDEARARLHPDRALEWLRVHYQSWFGDRTEWSDDIADRFYKDTATLTLFCQNFKFSKEVAK